MKATHYLDHNASAPLLPAARAAICGGLDVCGNPSSVHGSGRAARALIEGGRGKVAAAAGAERSQVVLTGSATEAINQAIVAGSAALGIDVVIVSAGEHKAVLAAAEASGKPVRIVGLDGDGLIDLGALDGLLDELDASGRVALVGVHAVNNETGVIQPIEAIERRIGANRHFLFVDAVQAFCKTELGFGARGADMMAITAHKIGGPAGTGALLMKGHCDGVRLVLGGGQETGRRGGTETAALIAGFGAAAEAYGEAYSAANPGNLARETEAGIMALAPDAVIFGANARRAGHVVNFAIPGLKNSVAMMALDLAGVEISSGSACASGKVGKSHVLEAMGVAAELVECGLRVSLGWNSNSDDVAAFLTALKDILTRQSDRNGVAA